MLSRYHDDACQDWGGSTRDACVSQLRLAIVAKLIGAMSTVSAAPGQRVAVLGEAS